MAENTVQTKDANTVPKKKKKKSRKLLWIIGGIVLIGVILAVVFSGKKDKLVTVQTVDISAEVSGEIISLPFKEGEEVRKNDLVVKIKQDAYSPALQEQNASIKVAESNLEVNRVALERNQLEFDRVKQLHSKGLATQSELDNAQNSVSQVLAQINSSEAQINQQRTGLSRIKYDISKTTIYSPMDGTVTQLNNELGEKVLGTISNQGSVIMTISDLAKMECQVEVGETDVTLVSLGDTARIEIDAFPDKIFIGYVYEIANTATSKGIGTQEEVVNFIVKIRIIDNAFELRPGMSCTVDIVVDQRENVLSVPIQSVTTREEEKMTGDIAKESEIENLSRESEKKLSKKIKPKEVVFVVDNNAAKKSEVKTGISDDSYIEITEGVNEGQEIVKGSFKAITKELEDGSKVKIDNEPKKIKKDGEDE
ncbi:MAG: efflux RND transporter periplasmic adaptor subunit [Ignavibacteria bacterium]|nr:efflux RND transporter periplasmic adaptor subunit [Ignavibacteria bacterium]